jgi:hypothetical protein
MPPSQSTAVRNEPGYCNKELAKRYIVLHVTFSITRVGYRTPEDAG